VRVDFALILVVLSALTGLIWLVDHLFFAKARQLRAAQAVAGNAVSEPVIVEYARSFFPVILAVLLIRSFLGEPFRIPSSSMMPTLLIGDFILVNKFSYGLRLPVLNTKVVELGEPKRGDVVVFRPPHHPDQDWIKRIIGLPGDRIGYHNKQIFVNGEPVPMQPAGIYIGVGRGRDHTGAQMLRETLDGREHVLLHRDHRSRGDGDFEVPAGHYFVMGDNRDNSEDGRFWGFVPEDQLVGRAFAIWMNWDSQAGGVDFSRIGTVIK